MTRTVEQRLQILERELRRSRQANRILIFAVIAFAYFAGIHGTAPYASKPAAFKKAESDGDDRRDKKAAPAANSPRKIETDQLVLLDRIGRTRARLEMTDQGPALNMFDERGRKRLDLSCASRGSGLTLLDADESAIVSLHLPENPKEAHLQIRNPQGSSLMKADRFSVDTDNDKGRVILSVLNGNFPVLGISQGGQQGDSSVEITAGNSGSRAIKICEKDGSLLCSLTANELGKSTLTMRNLEDERILQISNGPKNEDGPVVQFFGPANEDGSGGILSYLTCGLQANRLPFLRMVGPDGSPRFSASTD